MTILSEQGGPQVRERGWESGRKVAFWQAPPFDDVYHPFGGGPGAGGQRSPAESGARASSRTSAKGVEESPLCQLALSQEDASELKAGTLGGLQC